MHLFFSSFSFSRTTCVCDYYCVLKRVRFQGKVNFFRAFPFYISPFSLFCAIRSITPFDPGSSRRLAGEKPQQKSCELTFVLLSGKTAREGRQEATDSIVGLHSRSIPTRIMQSGPARRPIVVAGRRLAHVLSCRRAARPPSRELGR